MDDLRWYDDITFLGGVDLTLWLKLLTALVAVAAVAAAGAMAL